MRWTALGRELGLEAVALQPWAGVGEDLTARYAEPQRHYHTQRHLTEVLDRVDELADHAADALAVRLAAWFHDAIYQPGEPDNEEESARLADRVLTSLRLAPERVAEVSRLVRLTTEHRPAPGDANGEVLCDADLAILGSPPDRYAAYTAAVRAEYAAIPDPLFQHGRATILKRLLDRPARYHTPLARQRYEKAAWRNLTAELAGWQRE